MSEESVQENETTMAGLARGVAKLLEEKETSAEQETVEEVPMTEDLYSIVEALLFVNE